MWAVVYRWYSFTGGDDGIHGVSMPSLIATPKGSYYFTLLVTGACLLVMYFIVKSPFGSALQGIRDNPVRSEAVGVNVKLQQLVALVIAGFFAGVAGVLFVVVDNSAFPDMLFWTLSLEILIMCLLGGWFTFLGPMLGAAIIVALRTFASTFTEYWTLDSRNHSDARHHLPAGGSARVCECKIQTAWKFSLLEERHRCCRSRGFRNLLAVSWRSTGLTSM